MESKQINLEIKSIAKYVKNQTQTLINEQKIKQDNNDIIKFFRNIFPELIQKIEEEFLPLLKKKIKHLTDTSLFSDIMTLIFDCFYLAINQFENEAHKYNSKIIELAHQDHNELH